MLQGIKVNILKEIFRAYVSKLSETISTETNISRLTSKGYT